MFGYLMKNSVSNTSLLLLKLGVAFFLTPQIVRSLGNHDYGIYEMVLSIVGYMGMLELGIQPSVTRFIARYGATNEEMELQRVFSSALVFSTLIGFFVALVLMAWALSGASGLAPKNGATARYSIFLVIVACQVLVSFPGNVVQCIHQGHQRYNLTNLITAINTVVGSVLIYFFLKKGYGLLVLTMGNTIGIMIKFVNYGFLLRFAQYGGYRFHFKNVSFDTTRELIRFGLKSFALGIASRVSRSSDPIVIGATLGPTAVVYYMIPANLINHLNNLVSAATLGFMPFFSEQHALGATEKTRQAFLLFSRYMVGISVCCFIGMIFLGPSFLSIWMGPEYAQGGEAVFYILAIAYGYQMLNPFHGRILTGLGQHGPLAKIRLFEAIANLGLSLVLVKLFGKEGVALGTLIPILVVEPIILGLVCRKIGGRMANFAAEVLWPSLLPGLAVAGFYKIALTHFIIEGYGMIALLGLVACCLFSLLFFGIATRGKKYRQMLETSRNKVRPISGIQED